MVGLPSGPLLAIYCFALIELGILATGARDAYHFLPRNTIKIKEAEVDFFSRSGREYYESIKANPKTKVIVYTISNDDGDKSVIVDDFVKKIRVVRGVNAVRCKATELVAKREIPSGEEFARLATDTNGTFFVQENRLTILDKKPIDGVNFLSQEALDACKGLPIYWSYPNESSNRRSKRGAWWGGGDESSEEDEEEDDDS